MQCIPGVDHILAQPLKRCSASRIKLNETCELAKNRQYTLCFGVCGCVGERISSSCRQITRKVPKTVKISLSYSCAVEMGHFDMVRWKYDSVGIFSMLRDTSELILWKKADKKCKDQKRSIFFAKGALIGQSVFQIQRVNAVHGRCSCSGVLGDIPSTFTCGVRRRVVL